MTQELYRDFLEGLIAEAERVMRNRRENKELLKDTEENEIDTESTEERYAQ